ncbi:MAG: DUF4340 domain-containing protein [Desulfobacterales bacterium]|nr:DUF4340 domain-containing protein [Desulfobacterales bacterium]
MKIKTLVILLIALCIIAGTGILVIRLQAPEPPEDQMGMSLLGQFPLNEITSITIKSAGAMVSLNRKADNWIVVNRFEYSADFSRISDFVRKLKGLKIGRKFEASEETLPRLSLRAPDDPGAMEAEKGVQVSLKGEKASSLACILLGKARNTGDDRGMANGQYLKFCEAPDIYMVDNNFSYLEKEPVAWLDKNLAKEDKNNVKKISCLQPDKKRPVYSFERPENGKDLKLLNLKTKKEVKKSALDRLAGALSSLRMEDVADPAAASELIDVKSTTRIEYQLFNGIIYRVYPSGECSQDRPCYLKLEIDYQKPAEEAKVPSEDSAVEKEGQAPEKTSEGYALVAERMNEYFSKWVYIIPKWQHNAFVTDIDELLEQEAQEGLKK